MKAKFVLLVFFTISILSVSAHSVFTADELTGKWKYTISNVPPEYETGTMTFEEKDGKMSGYLNVSDGANMKDLTVDQGKVTFKLDFQGGEITFNMTREGDKMSGTLTTQDGEFPIVATKEGAAK